MKGQLVYVYIIFSIILISSCFKRSNFEYLERVTMSNIQKIVKSVKLKMNVFTNSSECNKKIKYLFWFILQCLHQDISIISVVKSQDIKH